LPAQLASNTQAEQMVILNGKSCFSGKSTNRRRKRSFQISDLRHLFPNFGDWRMVPVMSMSSILKSKVLFIPKSAPNVEEMRFWRKWAEHEPFLLRLCLGWVGGNESDARELLSSAMLKAWDGAHKTQDEIGNYRAWLAKIVRHHCIDLQRRQNRDPQIKTDPELLGPIAELSRVTHQASPESTLLKEESYSKLLAHMESLPMPLREVMMLRAYQNMSYKEIGQQLHISTDNARKRVQMARTLLRGSTKTTPIACTPAMLQQEGEAADAILLHERLPAAGAYRFASPVSFMRDGLQFELAVLHDYRPMRLAQKADTLRKYLDRHPSGWKKELELARLCWAMGEADEALERLATAIERQAQVPELVLTHLRLLLALGDHAALQIAAQHAQSECGSLQGLRDLYAGFEAFAVGNTAQAEQHWQQCKAIGGDLQLAQLWLGSGRKAAARDLLRLHLQRHPMDREAHLWMAMAAADTAEGLHIALQAQRRFPSDPYAAASVLVAQWHQQTDEAVVPKAEVTEVMRLAPDSYVAMALKAAWAQRHDLPDKAQSVVDEFLATHPQHWQALHFAIKLLRQQGKSKKANALEFRRQKITQTRSLPSMALDIPFHFLD
jgi:RNA polymerase sigma factor (sigma-70 family)